MAPPILSEFELASGAPPDAELRAFLLDHVGHVADLDTFEVRGSSVRLICFAGLARTYAIAFLLSRGAVPLRRGRPITLTMPPFVAAPWRSFSLWQRVRFRWTGIHPRETPLAEGRYR